MTEQIFAALPQDAVLITYWDALTPLSYKHCMEGVRPDVSLRAYDEAALVTCDRNDGRSTRSPRSDPVYALMVHDEGLAANHEADARAGRHRSSAVGPALPAVHAAAVSAGPDPTRSP